MVKNLFVLFILISFSSFSQDNDKKNDFIDLSNMIEKFINLNNNQKKAMGIYGYKKYALDLDIDKVNAKYIDLIYK